MPDYASPRPGGSLPGVILGVGGMRQAISAAVFCAVLGLGTAVGSGTAGAAKAVDNCATVTVAELQAIVGATYGTGTPLTTPSPWGGATVRAEGFPETGCVFSTGFASIR